MRHAAVTLFLFLLLTSGPLLNAQGLQVDAEEFKRLAGEVADLRDANIALQKRVTSLQKEVDSLRDALRENHDRSVAKMGDFATREDLKKTVDQIIKEVDTRREADRKLIMQELETIGKAATQQAAKPPKRKDPEPDKTESEKPIEGNFIEYAVKSGDGSLSQILTSYNKELEKQGRPTVTRRQVLQANPKLNPDRIIVGQKLQLPYPDKKK